MRTVCITPAGRRHSMRILAPYVLSDDTVDEWQVWLNTTNELDLAWLAELGKHAKVHLIKPPRERPDGIKSINQFWRYCYDDDAIYIRLDDDIVWLAEDFFPNMLEARKKDQHSFLISAMVVNNALCTYLLQIAGVLKCGRYLHAQCMDATSWRSGEFAEQLHTLAIDNILAGKFPHHFGEYPIAMTRFSINAICFWGRDVKPFTQNVSGDEEEVFSCILPTSLHKANLITTKAWCCHYAFHPQKEYLDATNILDCYSDLMKARFEQSDVMDQVPPI